MRKLLIFLITLFITIKVFSLPLARLKYNGGGDWYNDPSIIPNITSFFNKNVENLFDEKEYIISFDDTELYNYPIIIMTGHGRVDFSKIEKDIMRKYLLNGGFLFIDDDYGMDKYIRPFLESLFVDYPLVKLGTDLALFNAFYRFNNIPKIHEHDKKVPQLFGIFIDQRLALLYAYETNITDGWASPDVHKDPPQVREKALKFGSNILFYILNQ